MAKKIDEAEVKKECPSCGLGVALDATSCEFCGWNFEEEDEWILQIEKLERDLMLEKQKFEPGSVNEKIEATLHNPATAMKAMKSAQKATSQQTPVTPKPTKAAPPARAAPQPSPAPAQPKTQPPAVTSEERPASKVRRVRTVKGATSEPSDEGGSVRQGSLEEKPKPEPVQPEAPQSGGKKVRIVRKVK